jgi:GT2 family glycosyltransferase
MHPVLILAHNCLELTKRCIESVRRQDIPVVVSVIDNGSTDGTFLEIGADILLRYASNEGVSRGWNRGLNFLFKSADHVLVLNNDVVIPSWFYRELLAYDAPFVTGFSVNSMEVLKQGPARIPLVGGPDFSAFLIRRDAWEKIGPFEEKMKFYAQDCDYHIRAAREGIPLLTAHFPFYHERSSTLRLASPKEAEEIHAQANADREAFHKKWGFSVGSEEYIRVVNTVAGSSVPFPGEIRL